MVVPSERWTRKIAGLPAPEEMVMNATVAAVVRRARAACCVLIALACLPATAADRLLVNTKVFTANPQQPYAAAVAVRDGRVLAVGSRAEVAAAAGRDAEVVDLGGHTLVPGLIDSHVHAVWGGIVSLLATDLKNELGSVAELGPIAAEAKRSGRGMSGDVLVISGIPLETWSHIDQLNALFGSAEYASQPVFLRGMDGHTGWANAALRRRAGLTAAYLRGLDEGRRAYFGHDAALEPNGFAVDEGRNLIDAKVPPPDAAKTLAGAEAAVHYLNSLGITSWLDPLVDEAKLVAYRELALSGKLTAHVAALPVVKPNDPHPLDEVVALRRKFANVPGLTIPGVKVFADGVVEYPSQTAAMTAPYANTGKRGDLLFDPERFAALCIEADRQGLLVHTHAIGDRAVHETLNGIEAARRANGPNALPHTITHLQFIQPGDIPRFKALGVIASYQLLWAGAGTDTIDLVQPYVDPAIYPWQYPARSVLDAGGVVAGASDWFVSSPNPFLAMYVAETRRGEKGVLDANEDMPREAMLYAYTRNAAVAMEQERVVGSIEPGKQADFAVLDRDVLTVSPEELKGTRVLRTMVAGEWVYTER
jgi:predicted amidohydrolase YtcJ